MSQLKGEWGLVTGARGELGREFAKQLARQGTHLILTAKNTEPLKDVVTEIEQMHGVSVYLVDADLSKPKGISHLCSQISLLKVPVSILINLEEIHETGLFKDLTLHSQLAMMRLNITALTQLTYEMLDSMLLRRRGWIMQVASTMGETACPDHAVYAATQSYVLRLAEALHYELKPFGIMVTALCPGSKKFGLPLSRNKELPKFMETITMTPEEVVKTGLQGMLSGKLKVVPGLINRMTTYSQKIIPKSVTFKNRIK